MSTPAAESATVYSGIRDVEIHVGESSPGERWPGGPYRVIELAAIGLIVVPTILWVDSHPAGTTLPALAVGASLCVVTVVVMRLLLPKGRPSLWTRMIFARNTLRPPHIATAGETTLRTDATFDPPQRVVDNLVYTRGGVYAEYLLDGLPVLMRSYQVNERAAKLTRNLGRYLPSGAMLRGLLVAEDTNAIMRNIVGTHHDKPAWVRQCLHWHPVVDNPTGFQSDGYTGPLHTIFWLTIPVDAGTGGRTPVGQGRRLLDWVAGRGKESQSSAQHYADTADKIVKALPDEFNIRAATPAQILWHRNHRAGLGVEHQPLPPAWIGPTEVFAADFPQIALDEGDNAERRWPSGKPLVRVYDPNRPDVAASYQTFLTIEHFPQQGIRFPRATYLHGLLNVNTEAAIEWVQHINVREPDQAQNVNFWYAKNIRDQMRQRGARGAFEGELRTKLDKTKAYVARLKGNPAERELDHTVIIAVGARDPDTLDDAVKQIRQELDNIAIAVKRRRGAQALLWKAFNTGSENTSPIDEFRNPTTAHEWALFLPLVSGRVGNTKGSPLAVDQTTARPAIILHDPEGAARRNKPTGLAVVGDPGGGKSNRCKPSALELIMRGARAVVFEPDTIGEWCKALMPFEDLGVRFIDPTVGEWCFDPLVIFDRSEAARMAASHILPWIGVPADSIIAKRYRRLVRPDTRDEHGITSHRAMLDHLRAQPRADEDAYELLLRLETAQEDFPGLFDDTLPPYKPDESAATVYLTGNLALPDAEDIANPHLYAQLSGIARAGMAIYGLLVDLEQQYMFSRRDRFDVMVFEECAQLVAYPAGARTVHLMTRRGRKHATGVWLITQDYRDLARMNDKFITQKWIFRITDRELASLTLKWAGIDVEMYPELVADLCEDTSPGNTRDDDSFGEAGAVDPHRRGEGFLIDELGRPARVRFFGGLTQEQAQAFDSTPYTEAEAIAAVEDMRRTLNPFDAA